MVSEATDVRAFLSAHPPFDHLPREQLANVSDNALTAYLRAGESLQHESAGLIVLRTGSMEVRDGSKHLVDRLGAGEYLVPELLAREAGYSVSVLEDCLYYEIPAATLKSLRQFDAQFDSLFTELNPHLVMASTSRTINTSTDDDVSITDRSVGDYMSRRLVFADADDSIRQAATIMHERSVSSLLIESNDELVGILTDRDLRNRVIAAGVADTTDVSEVMTPSPLCISPDNTLSEAQLSMMTEGISHLPVVHQGKVQGLISLSDVLRARNAEPLPLVHAIHRSNSVERLAEHSQEIPALIAGMIESDARPAEIGRILTSFADAMTRRLITLATAELGPAPVAYAWLAFGSQARQEMVLGSDQDNGLLLADACSESDMQWFESLAKFVNDGLDRCGMPYCPGDVMAKNPKWRLRLHDWQACFSNWIEEPSPQALMHSSIFFDIRRVYGDDALVQQLHGMVLDKARSNTIFHAMMNSNAQQHSPPLGFFKNFVLETDGDHQQTLELKKRGTIPIVDIARNCSLSAGVAVVNTIDRLHHLVDSGAMSAELSSSLIDAHEFIAGIRLHAQAGEIRRGKQPDNHLDPQDMSPLVRNQLKDAFSVVREGQQAMTARFGGVI